MPKKKFAVTSSQAGLKGQKLISKFHGIKKKVEMGVLEKSEAWRELESLGGIIAYQKASAHGSRIFNTAKWLIKELKERRNGKQLKLLDVGALSLSYQSYDWVEATYIDLHPLIPSVQRANILDYESKEHFDVVCLSLVLNFEGCARKRKDIIVKAIDLLKNSGYLFVVLPKPAIFDSRYLNIDEFMKFMESLKLKSVSLHNSAKLTFLLFQKDITIEGNNFFGFSKHSGRNNFRIKI